MGASFARKGDRTDCSRRKRQRHLIVMQASKHTTRYGSTKTGPGGHGKNLYKHVHHRVASLATARHRNGDNNFTFTHG